MSGAVIAGLFGFAVMLLAAGLKLRLAYRDTPTLRYQRAHQYAKAVDLALPDRLVDPLAARVRGQAVAQAAIMMLDAPLFGLFFWSLIADGDDLGSGVRPLVPPQVCALLLLLPLTLALPLGHSWEVARRQRAGGPRIARLERVELREALPWWYLWPARLVALLSPVAGAVILVLPGHHPAHGRDLTWFGLAALTVSTVLGLWAVERYQRQVLNGRQVAGSVAELAFDESFRVQAVVGLTMVVPLPVYMLACFLVEPSIGRPAGGPVDGAVLMNQVAPFGLLLLLIALMLPQPVVRRYYRRARRKQPPTPETVPC